MSHDSRSPFFTSNFATGVIIVYGALAFLLGAVIGDLYAQKPGFAAGGTVAGVIVSAAAIKVVEGTLDQEAENKAKDYLRPYRMRLDELEIVIETLETEADREHALEVIGDLKQTIKAFEEEYEAAKNIAKWLSKTSNLESLRNKGIEIVISKYKISEEKTLKLFTHDIHNYLILLKETLPSLEPWKFEERHLCLAYQEGLLLSAEPYVDAVNYITQNLEEMSGNTGVVSSVSRLFSTYLDHLVLPKNVQTHA